MIPHRADLTIDEVRNPSVLWCKSGHDIPEGMKVYSVVGPALSKSGWGQYCEACLAGAHLVARVKRNANEPPPQPEQPEPVDPAVLKKQLRRFGFVGGIAEVEEESPTKEAWEDFVENTKL